MNVENLLKQKDFVFLYGPILPNIMLFFNCNKNNSETENLIKNAFNQDKQLYNYQTHISWSPYGSNMMSLVGNLDNPMSFMPVCPAYNPECCQTNVFN